MRDALICGGVRTPIGKYGGVLRDVRADELAATVLTALVERIGLPPERIDDVILGQCYPSGEDPALGRLAALRAGFPVEVPGFQLDRRCGSGLQAICLAAMEVQTGVADVVVAGGADSMSNAELYVRDLRWGARRRPVELLDRLDRARQTAGCELRFPIEGGMIETAENVRERYRISREEQDLFALRSHRRAVAAWDARAFDDHVVVVEAPRPRGGPVAVTRDEGPREDTSLEALAKLPPVRGRVDPSATVTAGNACSENDAAAALVVASPEAAAELGLQPVAVLRAWAAAGVDPRVMGMGPVPAIRKALGAAGLEMGQVDLVEINEAFAVQVLACADELGMTRDEVEERLNVNGGAIALGHPVGATGARILVDLLAEMRRRGARYGVESMCIGGGQGLAAVFELVA